MLAEIGFVSASDAVARVEPSYSSARSVYTSVVNIMLYWLWILLVLVNNVVVVLPKKTVSILQTRFLVTLSLLLMLLYLAITVSLSYLIVRHKYLTRYSKNSPAKPEKSGLKLGVGVDYVNGAKKKRGTDKSKNYLDEFLSAIKVFGYLERPVFHELTKSMTTQKLACDEILYLEEKLGFSIVVEGTVQVFTKVEQSNGSPLEYTEQDLEDVLIIGEHRYQLLNEVKSGSPLSSLLSTLDLFRSRNSLSSPINSPEKELLPKLKANGIERSASALSPNSIRPTEWGPQGFLWKDTPQFQNFSLHSPSFGSTVPPSPDLPMGYLDQNNLPSLDYSSAQLPDIVVRPKKAGSKPEDSTATIAIIPHLSFQRVQSKYPKATSHIVTMVLMRLHKVTMNAVHNYLGLTKEIFDCEVALNASTEESKLPSYLYNGVIEKFNHYRTKQSGKLTSVDIFPKSTKKPRTLNRESSSRYVVLASRSKSSHPGDLLSSVPLSRKPDLNKEPSLWNNEEEDSTRKHPRPKNNSSSESPLLPKLNKKHSHKPAENIRDRVFSDEREETEETSLRVAIVEIIFKMLGIEELALNMNLSAMTSGQLSANSSQIGLSALMGGDNSVPISGEKYLSDFTTDATQKGLSFKSTSRPSSSLNLNSQKFYNTIYQTKDGSRKVNGQDHLPDKRRESSSLSNGLNFASIKNAFSKYIEVKYYAANTTLVPQNSSDTGLYYVIDGSLEVLLDFPSKSDSENLAPKTLYVVNSGELAGYLSTILGFKSLVGIKSGSSGAIVAHISKKDISAMMDKFYFLQLPVAAKLKSLLPGIIRTIDFALEWCHIPAGGILCNQGDLANGFHIVLSGRFRVIRYKNLDTDDTSPLTPNTLIDNSNVHSHTVKSDDYEVLGEYGHGESVGEVEVLTASRRTNSLIAVRDSETARIPRALFEMLSMRIPSIMVKVTRIVADRAIQMSKNEKYATAVATVTSSSVSKINSDYKTITILPTVNGLPVREFSERLVHAMKAIGLKVIALDQASILTHLGRNAFDERLARLKLSGFFAFLEEEYDTVIYVCDTPLKSNWTSTCISQGDCILLLADAEDDECATSAGDYEKVLLKLKTTARTELCLIHPEKSVFPGSTSIWLKNRLWVHGHHHIQMELLKDNAVNNVKKKGNILSELALKLSSKANPNIKLKFENVKSRAIASLVRLNERVNYTEETSAVHKNDFLRLARILSNQSVGLVLGGGGSRGISHVGVVTALEKHGIPVDMIGGTSIGSFVGGLYAKEYNSVSIYGMTKKFSRRIGSIWRSILDLTYPVTSYITGYEFNRGIWKVFGYHQIEDFWIRYFCNSTNITNSTMEIHETGYAWRFIRASMSLAGLLPPITFNGSMLLDGGYLDNLPVLEMKNRGAKYIIAVDVGSIDDRTPMNYGDTLSGFWVLLNRINPFSKHPNVPNMMEIQLRLAYVASVNALEMAKRTPGVIYLRPPIDDYATLDFLKFDEIYNVGLAYADKVLTKWESEGKLPSIPGMKTNLQGDNNKLRIYRRNSI